MSDKVKSTISITTDAFFVIAAAIVALYVADDMMGVIQLRPDIGRAVAGYALILAPVSLFFSVVSILVIGSTRFKWYAAVSALEVIVMAFVAFVFLGFMLV